MRILIILALAATIFGSAGYFTWFLFIKPQEDLKLEKLLPPPPPPPDPTVPDFNRIAELQKQGKVKEARAGFADFVERYPESTKLDEARSRLGEMNSTLFFSNDASVDKDIYVVKPGDVISRVANKYKASPELLIRINNLRPNARNEIILQIGQRLAVPKTEFSASIDRKSRKVLVQNGGKFFKQYTMRPEAAPAAGKKATPAPAGRPQTITGRVVDKISWKDGNRVTFADKGYNEADHWIVVSPSGHSFYTDREVGANEPKVQKPPGGGYGLPSEAMHELAALLKKNTPVSIE